jgi:hypothetical protein
MIQFFNRLNVFKLSEYYSAAVAAAAGIDIFDGFMLDD